MHVERPGRSGQTDKKGCQPSAECGPREVAQVGHLVLQFQCAFLLYSLPFQWIRLCQGYQQFTQGLGVGAVVLAVLDPEVKDLVQGHSGEVGTDVFEVFRKPEGIQRVFRVLRAQLRERRIVFFVGG
jgi:hypothetical protein